MNGFNGGYYAVCEVDIPEMLSNEGSDSDKDDEEADDNEEEESWITEDDEFYCDADGSSIRYEDLITALNEYDDGEED